VRVGLRPRASSPQERVALPPLLLALSHGVSLVSSSLETGE
jgi:hypothetical protein